MSYTNNPRNGPGKSIFSYGAQMKMPSSSAINPYDSRTSMIYTQSPAIQRNPLTESEPLSPYSEMQIPMTQTRPSLNFNTINIPSIPSQEIELKSKNSNLKKDVNKFQNNHNARPAEMQAQRIVPQDVRFSPYGRSSFSSQPQLALLPHPTPQYYVTTTPNLSFNPDQSFFMQPTPFDASDRSNIISSNAKKTEGAGLIKINTNNVKTASKLTAVSRKRYMIGSIDQIIQWNKLAKEEDIYVIYEVSGILENITYHSGGKVYKMIFCDDQKANLRLQAVFFPIDRDIPEVRTGELVTFVGRMRGAKKLHVFSMWPTDSNSLAGLKRISFLCQRTMQEACLSAPEP